VQGRTSEICVGPQATWRHFFRRHYLVSIFIVKFIVHFMLCDNRFYSTTYDTIYVVWSMHSYLWYKSRISPKIDHW
jgi:hypothetical protein